TRSSPTPVLEVPGCARPSASRSRPAGDETMAAMPASARRARAGSATVAHPAPPPPSAPPRPARPPHPRLVEGPSRRTRRRRRRTVVLMSLTIVILLTVVAFHVYLAQGQLALDHLGQRLASAQQRYEAARATHARESAPERIVQRAQ